VSRPGLTYGISAGNFVTVERLSGLLHFSGFGLLLELGGKSKLVVVVAIFVVWYVTHKHCLVGNSHRATFFHCLHACNFFYR
jgi:hypothetical protein